MRSVLVLGFCNEGFCTLRAIYKNELKEWEDAGYKYITVKAAEQHIRYHINRAYRPMSYYINETYRVGHTSLELEKRGRLSS